MTLTTEAALAAIATSRIEASLARGRTSFGTVEESPNLSWSISGIPLAGFNAVVHWRFGADADAELDAVLRHFAARSMPVTWWIKGTDDDLERRLRERGFVFDGHESPGMAIALTSPALHHGGVPSPAVERVTERREVRTWIATLIGSFEATASQETLELATHVFAELSSAPGWYFYLARVDGHPVGTAALYLGKAAGLYSVGTLVTARRQGVGTALSLRALQDARSAGYAIVTLTASEVGARLYRSLGFDEYCRYREYFWRPGAR